MRKYIIAAVIAASLVSCAKEALEPVPYTSWVENEDNGLRSSKVMGEYKLTLQYKPVEYVIVREEKTEAIKASVVHDRTKQLGQMQYYNLRLEPAVPGINVSDIGVISDTDHAERINYFTFGMQENIYLVDGGDTLGCKLFQYERTYDLAPYIDFVLAFELPDSSKTGTPADKVFVLDGTRLGIGPVRFQIDEHALTNIPALITY